MIDPEKLRAATKAADDYLARLTDADFVRRRKRLFALAAATGTAKTAQQAECEASQSGPKGSAQKDKP